MASEHNSGPLLPAQATGSANDNEPACDVVVDVVLSSLSPVAK